MSRCVLPYRVEVVPGASTVTARGGLALMVEMMLAAGMSASFARHVRVRERQSGYSEAQKGLWLMLLLGSGGDCIDDIQALRADEGLCRVLGGKPPSPGALLQYLYAFHDEELIEKAKRERPQGQEAYIPQENAALMGLGRVNVDWVRWVASHSKLRKATLDHDATILEAHKEQALWHYKGGRGYQPAAIYWAEQDLVVADEFRDGNVPAGMNNLALIQRGFAALPETVSEYSLRADSACYDERVLKWLCDPAREGGPRGTIGFTISADMTEQLRAACAAVEKKDWELFEKRADETVWCSEVEFTPGNWPKESWPLRYLVLRIKKKQGWLFAQGDETKYLAVVTNRQGDVAALIRWHWQKAGTIEQVHDVTKNELAAGTPPCGGFGANAAWYRLSLMTYNVLSAMKSLVLPGKLSSARPKRLRFAVLTIPARVISHAGQLVLRVAEEAERIAGLVAARAKLAVLAQELAASSRGLSLAPRGL